MKSLQRSLYVIAFNIKIATFPFVLFAGNSPYSTEFIGTCTLECPGDIYVEVFPGETETIVEYTVTANMCVSGVIQTSGLPSGSAFPLGTTTNCFFASDGLGNDPTCCFTVTVAVAQVYCPPAYIGECGDSQNPDNTGWPIINGNDISPDFNCFHASYSDTYSSLCGEAVHITRSWTITNTCSVSPTVCVQDITLTDDQAPELICPSDYQVSCDGFDPNEIPSPIVFDACGSQYDQSFSHSPIWNNCPDPLSITGTWTVIDDCNNASSCSFTIEIVCQPTIQAHHISFSEITQNSMRVHWTSGNGNNRLVAMNTTNNFPLPPAGFDPPINTAWQNEGVQYIFLGDDEEVLITNLDANTTYWFRVFEASDCSGENIYITSPAINNPKSQATPTGSDPSSVVPSQILSPLPSTSFPGLFQSNLPYILWNAQLPFSCIMPFKCKDNIWNQTPNYPLNETPGELIPYASSCFSMLQHNWEFRQRGFITGVNGSPCSTLPCSSTNPTISHSSNACSSKDDRYAWDARFPLANENEVGICVFSVAEGDVTYVGNQAIKIKHPKNCTSNCWYSWYDNILPTPGLSTVSANQHIGHIKQMTGPHLHFGVYYLNSSGKLISVNRPISPNFTNINGEAYTSSNIKGTCLGSLVSGASLYFKKENTWFSGGKTDVNGRFNFVTVPGLIEGDSIKVVASGFETMKYKVDSYILSNNNIKLPLIENGSLNGVIMPSFKAKDNKSFFTTPEIQLEIKGENYVNYDVVKIVNLEEDAEYVPLSSNHVSIDTVLSITLPDTGQNIIGIIYKGQDTVLISNIYYYYPDQSNACEVIIDTDSSILGAKMYLDYQYIKDINKLEENIDIMCGEHYLTFSKNGYRDTTLIWSLEPSLSVILTPIPNSVYSDSDSCIFNFSDYGKILYCRNVTVYDSLESNVLSLVQYYKDFTLKSLKVQSRIIEFHAIAIEPESKFISSIALDQINSIVADSAYLMRIYNDTLFHKFYFGIEDKISFDNTSQKLNYTEFTFNNGLYQKEAIVIMKRQAPISLSPEDLSINYGDSLYVPMTHLYVDPDSIFDDITYSISLTSEGLTAELIDDTLLLVANKCFSGNTFITLTATHDELQTHSDLNIKVNSGPEPSILVEGNPVFCQGDSLLLTASSGSFFQWNQGETSQSIWVTQSGEFFVSVIDSNGCSSNSDTIKTEVNPLPVPTLLIEGNSSFCTGDSSILISSDASAYNWNTGDTLQSILVYTSGEYFVAVTDTNGCPGVSNPLSITAYNLPIVDLGPDITSNLPVSLDAGNPGSTYEWNTHATSQTILVDSTGWFSVTVTDSNGCQSHDSIYIEILTGTITLNDDRQLKIYPNPNNGSFTISGEFNEAELVQINIVDTYGESVFKSTPSMFTGSVYKNISVKDPIPGVYFIIVTIGSTHYTTKMVIDP